MVHGCTIMSGESLFYSLLFQCLVQFFTLPPTAIILRVGSVFHRFAAEL